MFFVSGDKYEAVSVDHEYKKYMMLKIRNVAHRDFGSYKCVAKNSLGETDGVIKLDGKSNIMLFFLHFIYFYLHLMYVSHEKT